VDEDRNAHTYFVNYSFQYFYKQFDAGSRVPTLGSDWYIARVPNPLLEDQQRKQQQEANAASSPDNKAIENDDGNDQVSTQSLGALKPTSHQQLRNRKTSMTRPKGRGMQPTAKAQASDVSISLQMWDTPGRERLAHRDQAAELPGYSFLKHADAIMLVYDMTSSTSFKQLLKWYADLVELKQQLQYNIPILVVANKLDLYQQGQKQREILLERNLQRSLGGNPSQHPSLSKQQEQRRDVLGLGNKGFRGKDYRYEYQVSRVDNEGSQHAQSSASSSRVIGSSSAASLHSHNNNTNNSNGGNHRHNHRQRGRMEMSYLADRDNWTTDGSYLESLFTSEDKSHPDKDMVILWCRRNGLPHLEGSAATGDGVAEIFETLIRLALQQREHQKQAQQAQLQPTYTAPNVQYPVPEEKTATETTTLVPPVATRRRNTELDVRSRYAPEKEYCCQPLLQPLLRLFQTILSSITA